MTNVTRRNFLRTAKLALATLQASRAWLAAGCEYAVGLRRYPV